jgi:hypothetical protein
MVDYSDGVKISEFIKTTTLSDSDLINLVRSGSNLSITVANFKALLGVGTNSARGMAYMQGNSTATVIVTQDVPVLVGGTWLSGAAESFSVSAAGRLTYTGINAQVFNIDASISAVAASGSPDCSLSIAKNGVVIAATKIGNRLENTHDHNLSTLWNLSLSTNDYIELFIENNSNTVDFTVTRAVLRAS